MFTQLSHFCAAASFMKKLSCLVLYEDVRIENILYNSYV